MASNNEEKFAKIDEEEIRFFIRKLNVPKIENHNIEQDLLNEIPAFLDYLEKLPPIDWTRDRTGFTPSELNNESLKIVKHESKSSLYKELNELFQEYFLNSCPECEVIYATPSDIKEMWFKQNTRIEIQYIRYVLKREFYFITEKLIRYWPLGNQSYNQKRIGKPFVIPRSMFVQPDETSHLPQ